jgi:hypothetical protein
MRRAGDAHTDHILESLSRPLRNLEYRRLVERVCVTVDACVPQDGRVLVISRGDDALLQLGGRKAGHFPQLNDGTYLGHHPADSAEAIEHLESLVARDYDYLVVPSAAYWWLDHYTEFREYLERHFALAAAPDAPCLVICLQEQAALASAAHG